MLMREPQHFVSLDSGQKSTNARCMGRMDAQCSLKLPAPSRGASAATHLLQALALLSAAGLVGTSDAIRGRETAAEGLSLLVDAGDAFSHSRPLRRGAAG